MSDQSFANDTSDGSVDLSAGVNRPTHWFGASLRFALLCIVFVVGAVAARAQDREVVIAACPEIAPLCTENSSGEYVGFTADLSRAIARIAGFDIEFRQGTAKDVLSAQRSGDIQLLAGISQLRSLEETSIVSNSVGKHRTRYYGLERANLLQDDAAPEGLRITFFGGGSGNNFPDILAANTAIPVDSLNELVGLLISQQADLAIFTDASMNTALRTMRLDHRIVAIGPPLSEGDRVVFVHQSRAHLMDRINDAIDQLHASGELQEMRKTWLIDPLPPAPDELIVGVSNDPPYEVISDNGFTGFAVEALRRVADRAGLQLRFREITPQERAEGPSSDGYDLLPQLGMTEDRTRRLDFTNPIKVTPVALYVRAADAELVQGLSDLAGRRLGVIESSPADLFASQQPGSNVARFADSAALLDALTEGGIDAALDRTSALDLAISDNDLDQSVIRVGDPLLTHSAAPALRVGLAEIRERLDAAMTGYVVSEEYRDLNREWFGERAFWTAERRQNVMMAGLVALILAAGGALWFRSHQASRRAAERMHLMANIAQIFPYQMLLISENGTIQYINKPGRRAVETYLSQDIVGMKYKDFLQQAIALGEVSVGERSEGDALDFMLRSVDEDGSEVEFTTSDGKTMLRRAARFSSGEKLLLHEDVTADRQIRDALLLERSRLEAIMDASHDGMIALNRNGEVLVVNGAARDLLGQYVLDGPHEWPQAICFFDPETSQPLEGDDHPIQRALSGSRIDRELFLLSGSADAPPRYFRFSSGCLPTTEDHGVATVIGFEDVNDLESNREVLERKGRLEALGNLTGGIAHDFNNLLATLQYSVELALRTPNRDKASEYLKGALRSVDRGAELTERLLGFAQRQPERTETASIDDVFKGFELLLGSTVSPKIDVKLVQDSKDLWIECDLGQLEIALLNLVFNSRDAIIESGTGSQITVTARAVGQDKSPSGEAPSLYNGHEILAPMHHASSPPGFVEITVSDDGPGMPDEVQRKAFDPFFTTKGHKFGTGLGLSQVYGFVQQMDGGLQVESEVGRGTFIRLTLPRGTPQALPEPKIAETEEPASAGRSILLVDDEAILLMAVSDMIELMGYEAIVASSGTEALNLVEKGRDFDLLLTDIVMPGGPNGFALAKKVRQLRPNLPVLYFSGYSGYSEDDMGDVPAPMLKKPCSPETLARAINEAFAEAE
ncbi:transporter substrate-binding domain-containing protein [Aliishimia ponticola]|uniref:histidine kinase n=1 Tax=Aliishimia ponticola TaxID=2499833 RepID=A0A4S4N6N5_9RHOB|nr:transporter substrate-binding domain-containing protein [Aliishimia ponticola]THH34719.1 transporter substrate-binding domain-containing protein [Aliishimia ponticola]